MTAYEYWSLVRLDVYIGIGGGGGGDTAANMASYKKVSARALFLYNCLPDHGR